MSFWNNFSLKSKMLFLTSFMLVIVGIESFNSFLSLNEVSKDSKMISGNSLPNLLSFTEMDLSFRSVRIELRTLGLEGITKDQEKTAIEGVKKYIEKFEAAEKIYLSIDFLPGEEVLYKEVSKEWLIFKKVGERILALNATKNPQDREKMIQMFFHECPESAERVAQAIQALMKFHKSNADKFVKDVEGTISSSDMRTILFGVIGAILGLSFGYFLSRQISEKITAVAKSLEESAELVTTTSTQIAGASGQLSQAATEQAASLEQTAASLEEITSMITKANENASSASSSSQESNQKAEEGRAAVDEMMNSMQNIRQSNEDIMNQIGHSNEKLIEIVDLIKDIGDKTKVINEIVFQTKLLSFNASVEAARAGEHGKGFAVVADEVGKLAQMSGGAAKEISDMLSSSTHKVDEIVRETKQKVEGLINDGKKKVEAGIDVASTCSALLSEIVQNSSKVAGLSSEIAEAGKEQSLGVTEINKAMGQLDTVTQQNASASEQAAGSARELAAQAETLAGVVSELIGVIHGTGKNKNSFEKFSTDEKNQAA